MKIGSLWHVNHVVDDHAVVADFYREVFGARDVFVDQWLDAERRWATMVTVADLAIDVMAPAPEGANLPLGRFLSRFGSRLHAVAYFADCPPVEIFDALTEQDVRCFGLAGGDRAAVADNPVTPVFTHPRDTAGQLEFMPMVRTLPGPLGVPGMWEDPRFAPDWSPDPWREHPLAIVGWRIGVVVEDLDRATGIYAALGATVIGESHVLGSRRRVVRFGDNTTIEIIRPSSAESVAGRDLAEHGEIVHSCVFETMDLAGARDHLVAHGCVVADEDARRLVFDPATTHGATIELAAH